jgi:hypothetical protein
MPHLDMILSVLPQLTSDAYTMHAYTKTYKHINTHETMSHLDMILSVLPQLERDAYTTRAIGSGRASAGEMFLARQEQRTDYAALAHDREPYF